MSREKASHARQARPRSIRFTLTGLMIIPLVSLTALWAYAASSTIGGAFAQRAYDKENNATGGPDSVLLDSLIQERTLTYVWLSAGRRTSSAAVDKQRPLTDAAITGFRAGVASAGGALSQETRQNLTPLSSQLNTLGQVRAAADSGTMSPLAVFGAYNTIVDAEFQFFRSEAVVPDGSISLYQEGEANIDAGQALEVVGREAALVGGSLAAGGTMSTATRDQFTEDVYDQRLLEQNALAPLNWPGSTSPYTQLFASSVYTSFKSMEDRIIDNTRPGARIPVSPAAWQSGVESFLTEFTKVSNIGRESDTKGAAHVGNVILLRLILVGGAGLAAVVISGLLLIRFGRRMTRELTSFLMAVRALADERLPLVVRRLRHGERVDIAAEAAPLALRATTREVTEIAEAFSTVQRTAVEAAVGEAELRAAASVVYRNLARRNQSLLQRQLGMLDSMERGTSDPEALDQLFRLDHLTTRMRRHAEGLIVLSGAPSGRRWRDPVPLVEVLRGAIGEIEDYTRVDLVASADGLVAGGSVADVTHLLAELIENAANYSPPGTRVTVTAGETASGLAVEVEDRGLGIPPQTLSALNDRLANPPEFDLADTDQLGLFVVSRLAARQEIRVALRGSPYGGMTAIVLLPRRIVVRKDDPAGPPRAAAPAVTGAPGLTAGASRRVRRAAAGEPDLPRRSPQANLAPQLNDVPPGQSAVAGGPSRPDGRSADQARALISSIRQGWRSGSTETGGADPDHDASDDGAQA
ncbi:MAG TPA: sensor histidine kinase [Trebonia sp.]|jgi:signal transduction histidine kinase|nr:sensor histidine kinase [Trebonia sp.]